MKNFKQPGMVVEVAAPAAVSSGDGVLVGSLFGVAVKDAGSGDQVNVAVEGVFELPKESIDVMSEGDKVNWDDTGKHVQLASGDLDAVATVVKAAGNGVTEVDVKLTPV